MADGLDVIVLDDDPGISQVLKELIESFYSWGKVVAFSDADGWLQYTPVGTTPTTGLIFYPGGKVPPAAYAPAAQAIAEHGYATFVVPMPFSVT